MLETARMPNARTTPSARHSVLLFFIATLLFTWGLQLPAVLAKLGVLPGPVERFVPLAALGGFGPLVAALLCARVEPGGPGVRGLLRRYRIWRVGVAWYAIALGLLPALYVVGVAVYGVAGGDSAGLWFFPPENAQHVSAMFLMPMVEEIGWRGFALPRLQQRYTALQASLLLGVVWALWHVMMFILQDVPSETFTIALADIVVGSVFFSWIYNHTRGSLLLAVLAHAGVHLNNPAHALPNAIPLAIQTAVLIVFAGAVLWLDRGVWREPHVERVMGLCLRPFPTRPRFRRA
jgi:membrane protease YdiL (CAAX protease family)